MSRRRFSTALFARLQAIGILGVLAAVASIPLSVFAGTWLMQRALIKEWQPPGRACPETQALSMAVRGAKPPAPFVYRGVAFAFQIGDVQCASVPEESLFKRGTFPVCQFDAPGGIVVTAGGRTRIFEPGVGHGASVTIHDGRVSCVMSGGFTAPRAS
jgi:hypothetical protein